MFRVNHQLERGNRQTILKTATNIMKTLTLRMSMSLVRHPRRRLWHKLYNAIHTLNLPIQNITHINLSCMYPLSRVYLYKTVSSFRCLSTSSPRATRGASLHPNRKPKAQKTKEFVNWLCYDTSYDLSRLLFGVVMHIFKSLDYLCQIRTSTPLGLERARNRRVSVLQTPTKPHIISVIFLSSTLSPK